MLCIRGKKTGCCATEWLPTEASYPISFLMLELTVTSQLLQFSPGKAAENDTSALAPAPMWDAQKRLRVRNLNPSQSLPISLSVHLSAFQVNFFLNYSHL